MRLSADNKSPDWHPVAIRAKVFLDEAEISHCLMADEERGQVIRIALDDAGKIIINRETGDIMTECSHGVVRIEIPDEHKHLLTEFPFGPMEALA